MLLTSKCNFLHQHVNSLQIFKEVLEINEKFQTPVMMVGQQSSGRRKSSGSSASSKVSSSTMSIFI